MNHHAAFTQFFSELEDPRQAAKIAYPFFDVLFLTVCAAIGGFVGWEDIETFGEAHLEWLQRKGLFPNGLPVHDTIARIVSRVQPEQFQNAFVRWMQATSKRTNGELVAIDGKTLRSSYDRNSRQSTIHMVSAFAAQNRLVLGQVKTDAKSNEITAIPELLALLDIKGCLVSIDAMGCQKKIASSIIEKKADYVLAVKENQPQLYGDIKLYLDDIIASGKEIGPLCYHETIDADHGRIETRKYWITTDIDWLHGKENWRGLKSIGCVERKREIGEDVSFEKSYFIGSIENDAELFAKAVRNHWGIENGLHWTLDMAFREDESRIRKGHAPENFAVLRHIALNLIKNEKTFKGSVNTKQLKASWNKLYLEKIIKVN